MYVAYSIILNIFKGRREFYFCIDYDTLNKYGIYFTVVYPEINLISTEPFLYDVLQKSEYCFFLFISSCCDFFFSPTCLRSIPSMQRSGAAVSFSFHHNKSISKYINLSNVFAQNMNSPTLEKNNFFKSTLPF